MQQVVVTESFPLITSDTLTFTCITQSSSTLFKPQSVDPSLHIYIYTVYTADLCSDPKKSSQCFQKHQILWAESHRYVSQMMQWGAMSKFHLVSQCSCQKRHSGF